MHRLALARQRMSQPLLMNTDFQLLGRIKQLFSLVQQSLRWSQSILCLALLLASVDIYEDIGSLNRTRVVTSNAITTVLSLVQSLVFFVGLEYFDLSKGHSNWQTWC